MGSWDYLNGKYFNCCFCKQVNEEATFETRLTDASIFQSNRQFSEGDQITIDGLDDYAELEPPHNDLSIYLIHEDWDCEKCGLSYQYSLINLQLHFSNDAEKVNFYQKLSNNKQYEAPIKATIVSVTSHIPDNINDLKGINYVSDEHIDWKYLCKGAYNIAKGKKIWNELSVEERKNLIIGRYKDWFNAITKSNGLKNRDIVGLEPYPQTDLKEYLLLVKAICRRFENAIDDNHLQSTE